jgi:hypothetical protein
VKLIEPELLCGAMLPTGLAVGSAVLGYVTALRDQRLRLRRRRSRHVIVTSARETITPRQSRYVPLSGGVFAVKGSVKGRAALPFDG